MIEVVNKRHGRGGALVTWQYIGRPSPLGNPFSIKMRERTREQAIAEYRDWLTERLTYDCSTRTEFNHLLDILKVHGELTLVCWCAPLPCHGDVVKEFLEAEV